MAEESMERDGFDSQGEESSTQPRGQEESDIKSMLSSLMNKFEGFEKRLNKIEKIENEATSRKREHTPKCGRDESRVGRSKHRRLTEDRQKARSARERSRSRPGSENDFTRGESRKGFARGEENEIARGDRDHSHSEQHETARGGRYRTRSRSRSRSRGNSFARDENYEEDMVSDDDQQSEDHARGGDGDQESVSEFRVQVGGQDNADALNDLEKDLEVKVQDGDSIHEKLAKTIFNRFTVSLPKEKLEEKLKTHKVPENCTVIKAPRLDQDLSDKGLIDRNMKKDDNRLSDIQSLLATATAALGQLSHELNSEVAKGNTHPKTMEIINKVIKVNGDVFAIIGHAQQELTQRRRFKIGSGLPREVAAIATAKIPPGAEALFDDDTDRLMKTARSNYKTAQSRMKGSYRRGRGYGHRSHPYRRSDFRNREQRRDQSFLERGQPSSGRGASSRGNNPRRGNYYRK